MANLTRAGKIELSDSVGGGAEAYRVVQVMSRLFPTVLSPMLRAWPGGILWTVILLKPALALPNQGFWPNCQGWDVPGLRQARWAGR